MYDLCLLDLDTVEPPLTVTSLQRPPPYNTHLSTTPTFLQHPPLYNAHLSTMALSSVAKVAIVERLYCSINSTLIDCW